MKVVQINTTVNSGSTGRIAEDIGRILLANGNESYIAFGRGLQGSQSNLIRVGSNTGVYLHGLKSLLLDRHGFGSRRATQELIKRINMLKPDVFGLHNIHGYFINIELLFNYIAQTRTPVVWTLHDCWPFTGHCSYFERTQCEKWKTECHKCPQIKHYPKSLIDRSNSNFKLKRDSFTGLSNLTIVTPSHWLKGLVGQSFLSEYPIEVIHNGVDINCFKPVTSEKRKWIILGVASTWDSRKGLADFIALRSVLPEEYQIVLIGLTKKQINSLPNGISGIARTESIEELVQWYSKALVFVNPTYVDNFPTTNIEALACGTPVITYDTGGSPEAIDEFTGIVVKKGDILGVYEAIKEIEDIDLTTLTNCCRSRAVTFFNKDIQYTKYLSLYDSKFNHSISSGIPVK